MTNLEKIIKKLDIQGGTIHQIVAALNKTVNEEAFTTEDILDNKKFKDLFEQIIDNNDVADMAYDYGYDDDATVSLLDDGTLAENLKDDGYIFVDEIVGNLD